MTAPASLPVPASEPAAVVVPSQAVDGRGLGREADLSVLLVDEVEFVKELYPRVREDDAAIERYRAAIEKLPPITVARGRVLVDGFHRWQAHRREGIAEIAAVDLGNLTDAEIVRESITRNSAHGQQLSAKDKQRLAGQLWQTFAHLNGGRVAEIASLLSVSERSVQDWTKDARTNEKADQQAKAWDLWLDCKDEREIESELGIPKSTVADWVSEKRKSADFGQSPESRQHFDVWSFQAAAESNSSYFGRMPSQVIENLLWLYTDPGDVVVDPFAGGGTTIDVAKAMGRRVWASDRKPSTPTLPIHEHDITTGWPSAAPKKADFILLDPPYWMQAKGRYSDSPDDLGNQSLTEFAESWKKSVAACVERLSDSGRLAYIVSPARDEAKAVVDLAFPMYATCQDAGLQLERRIIVTYQTQQASGQQVEWARENRELLVLYRDLVVFRR